MVTAESGAKLAQVRAPELFEDSLSTFYEIYLFAAFLSNRFDFGLQTVTNDSC